MKMQGVHTCHPYHKLQHTAIYMLKAPGALKQDKLTRHLAI